MKSAALENPVSVAVWSQLKDRSPSYALIEGVDLVVIRFDDKVSVFYGRCHHRGALLADGIIEGHNLICGVHGWDYRYDTGVSEYNNSESLAKFTSHIDLEKDTVFVDAHEVALWVKVNPQPFNRDAYLGLYADTHGSEAEPHNTYIQTLSKKGPKGIGAHGPMSAMGVASTELPQWGDIQILTAQLHKKPLLDHEEVETSLTIGPASKKPLRLEIPVFVSDMSFGALSQEAKIALAKGAEMAKTGICSGEGGMLPEEQLANSKYFYELASGKFGWDLSKVEKCQAFHFKGGQGAKTGTGGHLPGAKVSKQIAAVRGLNPGQAAISPARFLDLDSPEDFKKVADSVREATGGIPVGFKLSAQHIEADIDFALLIGVDYIILDGRGGGTGAAPDILKDNISVPTMAALGRARRHLDLVKAQDVTLIITGGLRTPSDFVKALALGADGIAVSNSALQAIGCLGMRACHTNNCPVGIATQKPNLRARLMVDKSATQLANFFMASNELMKVVARACGHRNFSNFHLEDLTTWKKEISDLTGISYSGLRPR